MSTQPLTSSRLEFDDADDAIEHYFDHGWTDGVPVVPPTVDKVGRFLEYAGRSPSEIVGEEPTKGRVITAEKAAINAVMAGCLPEYFPVVLAAVDAISQPEYNLHAVSVSTMGAATLTVVNGPIARELGLNSGVAVFGPGHRANATIGRAISLVISNVTGAASGVLDKGTLGHAGRYTWCIAEAESLSPWEPLHVERGYAADRSTVTVFAGISPTQVGVRAPERPEVSMLSFRDALLATGPGQEELIVVLSPESMGYLGAADWSKSEMKKRLFGVSRRSVSEWNEAGFALDGQGPGGLEALVGVGNGPDNITVVVAGGMAGANCAVIPLWGGGSNSRSVTRGIKIPG